MFCGKKHPSLLHSPGTLYIKQALPVLQDCARDISSEGWVWVSALTIDDSPVVVAHVCHDLPNMVLHRPVAGPSDHPGPHKDTSEARPLQCLGPPSPHGADAKPQSRHHCSRQSIWLLHILDCAVSKQ